MLWRKLNLNWRYAIGEFAIVVLGVLAAFWVENWNSERKDRDLEREYIDSLIVDLEQDLAVFHRNIEYTEEIVGYVNQVLEMVRSGQPVGTPEEVATAITNVSRYTFASQRRVTYDDLQSTGNLRIIRSDTIRSEIAEYYASWDFRAQWRGSWRSYQTDILDVLPEIIDPNIRDAIFFTERDFPWYNDEVDLSTIDSAALVTRMIDHPTFSKAIHNMRRAHGLNYGFAESSIRDAQQLADSLRDYRQSL